MNKEQRYQQLYMDIAARVAEMSYAQRAHVGAVIVKDGRIISMGWNGMPSGWDNNCEIETYETQEVSSGRFYGQEVTTYQTGVPILKTRPEVLHAESNAIAKLACSTESGQGADLYITLSPCIECAKLIHQSKISRVFYKEKYRNDAGIEFLNKSGVDVQQLNMLYNENIDASAI